MCWGGWGEDKKAAQALLAVLRQISSLPPISDEFSDSISVLLIEITSLVQHISSELEGLTSLTKIFYYATVRKAALADCFRALATKRENLSLHLLTYIATSMSPDSNNTNNTNNNNMGCGSSRPSPPCVDHSSISQEESTSVYMQHSSKPRFKLTVFVKTQKRLREAFVMRGMKVDTFSTFTNGLANTTDPALLSASLYAPKIAEKNTITNGSHSVNGIYDPHRMVDLARVAGENQAKVHQPEEFAPQSEQQPIPSGSFFVSMRSDAFTASPELTNPRGRQLLAPPVRSATMPWERNERHESEMVPVSRPGHVEQAAESEEE